MANSVKLSELHGVVVSESEDFGFDDAALSSRPANDDDVFVNDSTSRESEKDGVSIWPACFSLHLVVFCVRCPLILIKLASQLWRILSL